MNCAQKFFLTLIKVLRNKEEVSVYRTDFDNSASTYDCVVTRKLLAHYTEDIISKLNLEQGMTCIDLGCGTGDAISHIVRFIQPTGLVIGYDLSAPMLTIAHEKLKTLSCIRLMKKDMIEGIREHGDNTIDIITSTWALGYSSPIGALHEIQRVLKKGGHVGILVNTHQSLYELQKLVRGILLRHPFSLKYIPPVNFPPSKEKFKRMIAMVGLSIILLEEDLCSQTFLNGSEFIAWMKTSGPCAGFRSALKEDKRDFIYKKIQDKVDKKGGITLTFRFIRFIGTKR
ncbi:MAG: class I SAM-dependent methyltransferase [bacterium]